MLLRVTDKPDNANMKDTHHTTHFLPLQRTALQVVLPEINNRWLYYKGDNTSMV